MFKCVNIFWASVYIAHNSQHCGGRVYLTQVVKRGQVKNARQLGFLSVLSSPRLFGQCFVLGLDYLWNSVMVGCGPTKAWHLAQTYLGDVLPIRENCLPEMQYCVHFISSFRCVKYRVLYIVFVLTFCFPCGCQDVNFLTQLKPLSDNLIKLKMQLALQYAQYGNT